MDQAHDQGAEQTPATRREPAHYQAVAANALPLSAAEDRQWAFIAHCGGILGCIPALFVFLVFRDRGPFTAQESREALNFTLPPTIVAAIANILALLVTPIGSVFAVIAVLIWIFLTTFSVMAAIHVNRGEPYRYRWNLRLIK